MPTLSKKDASTEQAATPTSAPRAPRSLPQGKAIPLRGTIEDPAVSPRLETPADRAARLQASMGNQAVLRALANRASEPVVGVAPESVRSTLRTPGRALDPATRAAMEGAFRTDFSNVRVHDGAAAGASARDVAARAYTVGPHIVFAPGQFRPSDAAGQRLLSHELQHVVQQRSSTLDLREPIAIGAPDAPAEREAHMLPASRARPMLRRQPAAELGPGPYPGEPVLDGRQIPDEGVSAELSDSPEGATSAERVFKWLQARAKEIGWLESFFGVDRRAIAGVVAWEALLNPRGILASTFGRFEGAGKAHTRQDRVGLPGSGEFVPEEVEQAGLLPRRSARERADILEKDALPYVAAGMRMFADIGRAYGVDISGDPGMLAWVWVSKDATTFITYLSKKIDKTFDVTAEEMPRWVMENLLWLESAVGASQMAHVGGGQPKLGTMETSSWSAAYTMSGRLPESREFLVTTGSVTLTIYSDTDFVSAFGYPMFVVLHRRAGGGTDQEIGEAKRLVIGGEETFTWSGLVDGLYYFELYSSNGVPVRGELTVSLGRRPPLPEAPKTPQPVLRRAPAETAATAADAGVTIDEGKLRANAARELVRALVEKQAVYGHQLEGEYRKAGWWWEETEFDCSKFVLWVMAGRKVGDEPMPPTTRPDKVLRQVSAPPFGSVADASAVSAMIHIVEGLVAEGKASAIDKERRPLIGDVMFWGGHVAIVVDVQPAGDDDAWVVYANMGTGGAGIVGVDGKGNMWLKASEVAGKRNLGVGTFKGYWTP